MSNTGVKHAKIADLKLDTNNFNAGTEFGGTLLERSIRDTGVSRGVAMSADGVMIAGNHVVEKLAALGIEDVIIVPTTGSTLVVTQRMDIQSGTSAFYEAAIADNRTSQIGLSWDKERIADMANELQMDMTKWGMDYMLDLADDEDQEDKPTEPVIKDKLTFKFSLSDMLTVKAALRTAKIEQDIEPDKDADNAAFMVIVDEYMKRRS